MSWRTSSYGDERIPRTTAQRARGGHSGRNAQLPHSGLGFDTRPRKQDRAGAGVPE